MQDIARIPLEQVGGGGGYPFGLFSQQEGSIFDQMQNQNLGSLAGAGEGIAGDGGVLSAFQLS